MCVGRLCSVFIDTVISLKITIPIERKRTKIEDELEIQNINLKIFI